jgi:hypothetical protein
MKKAAVPSILVVVVLLAVAVIAQAQQSVGKVLGWAIWGMIDLPRRCPERKPFGKGFAITAGSKVKTF